MILWQVFTLFLSMGGSTVTSTSELRYFEKINHRNYQTNNEFTGSSLFSVNQEGNLTAVTNILLGVAGRQCYDALDLPIFKAAQRYAGGDSLVSVSLPAEEFPSLIEGCAAVYFIHATNSLHSPSAVINDITDASVANLIKSNLDIIQEFQNGFDIPVDLYWHNQNDDEPLYQFTIPAHEAATIKTRIGDVFSAHEHNGLDRSSRTLDFMVAIGGMYALSPENRLDTCDSYDNQENFLSTFPSCDDMERRVYQFCMHVWYGKRLGTNFMQPKLVPAVTEEGFMLRRLPEKTFKWIKEWYDKESVRSQREQATGVCMNQLVAPAEMTTLPERLERRLDKELKPILQEWFGNNKSPLELTSIYGARKYTNGSVLRMHVDTLFTHVVSAIINIDQEVDKDWPLVILNHDGQEERVIMKPGDMLMYESAKLIHGRPDKFVGAHYDNIFIHYKPSSGWDFSWL